MNPDTNQHPFGSHHQPLEPSVQGQATQSANDNHFVDDVDFGFLTDALDSILDQPTGHGLDSNGSINGPQAPTTIPSQFVPSTPHINPDASQTQFLQTQNVFFSNQQPTWQYPPYEYPAVIPPTASNPATYSSVDYQMSTNDFYYVVAQPGPSLAQNRQHSQSHEPETAVNPFLQPSLPQAEDSERRYNRTRADESPACDLASLDPPLPEVPDRYQPFIEKMFEILSGPDKPPRSREKTPSIKVSENLDNYQLIRDCQSQKPAEAGGLKYLNPRDASAKAKESEALYFKSAAKCTYPSNDATFPTNDLERLFCARLIYEPMVWWKLYQEWRKSLPKELSNKEQGRLNAKRKRRAMRRQQTAQDKRQPNKASKSGSASIRSDESDDEEEADGRIIGLKDLLPTPEQAKSMPSVAKQQERVLGTPLNEEIASQLSWELLDHAIEAQQGHSGARPGTKTGGSWESYPSFLERILALAKVLKTSKQPIKNMLNLGDEWSRRLANNPWGEQASKIENAKNNTGKKFSKLEMMGDKGKSC